MLIRVSTSLVVSIVIGPAYLTAAAHTYSVPVVDLKTAFTVALRKVAGGETARAYARHEEIVELGAKKGGATRFVTARIPTTGTTTDLLDSLDVEACAVLLSKGCVVSSGGVTNLQDVFGGVRGCDVLWVGSGVDGCVF